MRRAVIARLLCSSTLLIPTALMAQTDPSAPNISTVAPGNVDTRSGFFSHEVVDLSIGSGPFPRSLSYSRFLNPIPSREGALGYFVGFFPMNGAFHSNWEIYISCAQAQFSDDSGCTEKRVHIGAQTWTFVPIFSGGYTNTRADGAQLVTYSDREEFISPKGDKITFPRSTSYWNYFGTAHVASRWDFPDGDYILFAYEQAMSGAQGWNAMRRLTSVTNSQGLGFRFSYLAAPGGSGFPDTAAEFRRFAVSSVTSVGPNCGAPTCASVSYFYTTLTSSVVSGRQQLNGLMDPLGRSTGYEWTADGFLRAQTRRGYPGSYLFQNTYSSGAVTQQIDRNGSTWTYTRDQDSSGNPRMTVNGPDNYRTIYLFDSATLLPPSAITDGLGNTTGMTYADAAGHISTITYPAGNRTEYTYDSRGNTTSERRISKNGALSLTRTFKYPDGCTNTVTCNLPEWTSDEDGRVTNYSYDPSHGGVTSITLPAQPNGVRPETRFSYGVHRGVVVNTAISSCRTTSSCAGTQDEQVTSIAYSGLGLMPYTITTSAGDGSISGTRTLTFLPQGDLQTVTNEVGATTILRYDAARQLVGIVGPDPDGSASLKPRAQRYTYNPDGQVALFEQGTVNSGSDADWNNFAPLQQASIGYDSYGRQNSQTMSAGGTTYRATQYSYNARGLVECEAIRMNPNAFGSLPGSACDLGQQGSYGPDRISRTQYDVLGRPSQAIEAFGVSGVQRDLARFTYSPNGKLKSVVDAMNRGTAFSYDTFDRPYQTCFGTADCYQATDYEQLEYDNASNVIRRRIRNGQTISYTHDALGRLTSKTPPTGTGNASASYQYDNFGDLVSAGNSNASFSTLTTYDYDARGRKTRETSTFNGGGSAQITLEYDAASRLSRFRWPDFYVDYQYDAADEMTSIRNNAGADIARFTYDDLGRITQRWVANETTSGYGFDGASRLRSITLTGAGGANIALENYNPADQIGYRRNDNNAYAWTAGTNTNTGYSTNGLNQYTAIGGVDVARDPKGNTTSLNGGTFSWGAENTLTTGGGSNYWHDALRRLTYISASGTRFQYDGGRIAGIYNASNTLLRRFVYGPVGEAPIIWYEGADVSAPRYMDSDERGSVVRITTAAGGLMRINTYDEFGVPGANNLGRFGFAGMVVLPEIGMNYARNRIYAPAIGRFMQPDPLGVHDGPNLYNYGASDPVNNIDPDGLATLLLGNFDSGNCILCNTSTYAGAADLYATYGGGWSYGPAYGGGSNPGSLGAFTTSAFQSSGINPFGSSVALSAWVRNAPGLSATVGGMPSLSAPQNTNSQCSRGGQAARLSTAMGYSGRAHDLFGTLADLGGGGKYFAPASGLLNVVGAGSTFVSSLQRGEPIDVAYMRATSPLVTGALGALGGALGGAAAGGAAGSVVPILGNGVGAVGGGIAGGIAGSIVGEKLGEMSAEEYAKARGYGGC